VVIYGREYWEKLINFQTMIDGAAISPKDLELFKIVDSPEEGFEYLREGLIKYHLGPDRPKRVGEVVPEIAKTNP
jgi:predicted Rossmann-fold nucleotide-binding protein